MQDEIVTALDEQQADLSNILSGLEETDWDRPSRCEGWTVSDVVLHVAQTNELAIASLKGRFADAINDLAGGPGSAATPNATVDDGAALMVERQRGAPGAAVEKRWNDGASLLLQLLGEADLHERVLWVAGELSARTLATTRLSETWIHTDDVAAAFGMVPAPTDRLRHIARLAWRTLPYAFARARRELAGPVAFELTGPTGDPWRFAPETAPVTSVRGDGVELCLVAARRLLPADTSLTGEGPDVDAVLDLVRTYA